MMLNYGTDAMLADNSGETILHQGCKFNNEALLKVLIERKVKLNETDNLGKTAFLHAVRAYSWWSGDSREAETESGRQKERDTLIERDRDRD